MLMLAGVVMAASAAQPPAPAPVSLAAKLEAGQVLRYDLKAALEVGPPGGSSDRLEQNARLRMTVATVEDDGSAVVRGAFETLAATWKPAGGEEATFEWKEGQELPEEAPPVARLYGALAAATLELAVGPDGTLRAATGQEKAAAAGREAGVTDPERVLGVFGPGALATNLGPVFSLDPEARPRKPGDTWKATLKAPGLGAAARSTTVERTLRAHEGGAAVIEAKITEAWQPRSGRPDLSEPTATPSDQRGRATEKWDTRAGRLASRVMESSATWTLQLQTSPPMQSVRTFKARVELSRVEGPAAPAAPPQSPEPRTPPAP
ncbi:MAG: hypothetical protein WD749_05730 [Phycisphaerales bacterium]